MILHSVNWKNRRQQHADAAFRHSEGCGRRGLRRHRTGGTHRRAAGDHHRDLRSRGIRAARHPRQTLLRRPHHPDRLPHSRHRPLLHASELLAACGQGHGDAGRGGRKDHPHRPRRLAVRQRHEHPPVHARRRGQIHDGAQTLVDRQPLGKDRHGAVRIGKRRRIEHADDAADHRIRQQRHHVQRSIPVGGGFQQGIRIQQPRQRCDRGYCHRYIYRCYLARPI